MLYSTSITDQMKREISSFSDKIFRHLSKLARKFTADMGYSFQAIIEGRETSEHKRIMDGYGGFFFIDKNRYSEVAMHGEHCFKYMFNRYNEIYRVITTHVCRRTYRSNMAKAGMNPKTLQYLWGTAI